MGIHGLHIKVRSRKHTICFAENLTSKGNSNFLPFLLINEFNEPCRCSRVYFLFCRYTSRHLLKLFFFFFYTTLLFFVHFLVLCFPGNGKDHNFEDWYWCNCCLFDFSSCCFLVRRKCFCSKKTFFNSFSHKPKILLFHLETIKTEMWKKIFIKLEISLI